MPIKLTIEALNWADIFVVFFQVNISGRSDYSAHYLTHCCQIYVIIVYPSKIVSLSVSSLNYNLCRFCTGIENSNSPFAKGLKKKLKPLKIQHIYNGIIRLL